MLPCTCSNLAVIFAQPPSLLDHGWQHGQPKWLRSHQRYSPWPSLSLILPVLLLLLSLPWLWLFLCFQCWHPLLQNRSAHLFSFYAKALIANCKTAWQVFAHVVSQCVHSRAINLRISNDKRFSSWKLCQMQRIVCSVLKKVCFRTATWV